MTLRTADLQQTLGRPGTVVIDCWAPWCGPCRTFAPVFERVAQRHPEITFAKVNVDVDPGIAQGFRVQGIPTLVVFRDGVLLFSQAGALSEASLEALVTRVTALDMSEVHRALSSGSEQASSRKF